MDFKRRVQLEVVGQLIANASGILINIRSHEQKEYDKMTGGPVGSLEKEKRAEDICVIEELMSALMDVTLDLDSLLEDKSYICIIGSKNEFYN